MVLGDLSLVLQGRLDRLIRRVRLGPAPDPADPACSWCRSCVAGGSRACLSPRRAAHLPHRSAGLADARARHPSDPAVCAHRRPPGAEVKPLVVASYNIHRGMGLDRRRDLDRIAAVIEEMQPDVIGLQEVVRAAGSPQADQAGYLARPARHESRDGGDAGVQRRHLRQRGADAAAHRGLGHPRPQPRAARTPGCPSRRPGQRRRPRARLQLPLRSRLPRAPAADRAARARSSASPPGWPAPGCSWAISTSGIWGR